MFHLNKVSRSYIKFFSLLELEGDENNCTLCYVFLLLLNNCIMCDDELLFTK